jgi:hypothetical protein
METAPAIRRIYLKPRPLARCKRNTAQPFKKRTAGLNRNGFLNHRFMPFYGIDFENWQHAEKEFFSSLENLCNLYGWAKPEVSGLPFPQNIDVAFQAILKIKTDGLTCVIIKDQQHEATLATIKTFNTGYHLYYIPVRPLWKMLQIKEQQPLAEMLCSVFSYLYQVIDIPFYGEEGHLGYSYETLKDWIENDSDGEDDHYRDMQLRDLDDLEDAGNKFLPILSRPFEPIQLQGFIEVYRENDLWDMEMEEVAKEFLSLHKDYPDYSIRDRVVSDLLYPDESERVTVDQYLSFYWSGYDTLTDTLFDMVNTDLQEKGYQEEPVSVQWFDKPQEQEQHEFDFETRLFSLVDKLTGLLNDLDDGQ